MLRSAATPYPERSCCMNQNQLDNPYRTLIVCGPKSFCTILGAYVKL
jgi:hypothetical protein